MAWPRNKPHDDYGVQATVMPAQNAEPQPGGGQNTGISGATHTVVNEGEQRPRAARRLRPIRYANAGNAEPAPPTRPNAAAPPPAGARSEGIAPPAGALPPTAAPTAGISPPPSPDPGDEPSVAPAAGEPLDGTILSGTVLSGHAAAEPDVPGDRGDDEPDDDYDDTAGLVYEAEPERRPYGSVRNDGLGIFGGVTTTEVSDDDEPTTPFQQYPDEPDDRPAPAPRPAGPAEPAWNQPIAALPEAGSEPAERRMKPFGKLRGARVGGGPPDNEDVPAVSVRDLPPDVQMSFIRDRIIIAAIVGVLSFILFRLWPLSVTLMIVAWVLDTIRRSRNAALYVNGGRYPGARKATSKQLRKMRRDGYFTLDARPIPGSPEVIDHLVIGPTGVYAIDSEKWNPKLPIRTWNNKKLYHGPESQKDRLEHAVWEASAASELLSGALGTEVTVRPALAIYGPKIPWDIATIRNVDVFTGSALVKYLKARGRMKGLATRLTREEVRTIYDTATRVLPDVAPSETYTPVG